MTDHRRTPSQRAYQLPGWFFVVTTLLSVAAFVTAGYLLLGDRIVPGASTPQASAPATTVEELEELGGSASDACGEVTISSSDSEPTGNCPRTFTRTYTATDACGNEAEAVTDVRKDAVQRRECVCKGYMHDDAPHVVQFLTTARPSDAQVADVVLAAQGKPGYAR